MNDTERTSAIPSSPFAFGSGFAPRRSQNGLTFSTESSGLLDAFAQVFAQMSTPVVDVESQGIGIEQSATVEETSNASDVKDQEGDLGEETASNASSESSDAARDAAVQSLLNANQPIQVDDAKEPEVSEVAIKESLSIVSDRSNSVRSPITKSEEGEISQTSVPTGVVAEPDVSRIKGKTKVESSEGASSQSTDLTSETVTIDKSSQETVTSKAETLTVDPAIASTADASEDRSSRRSPRKDRDDRNKQKVSESASPEAPAPRSEDSQPIESPKVEASLPVPALEPQSSPQVATVEAHATTESVPVVAVAGANTNVASAGTSAPKTSSQSEGASSIQPSGSAENSRGAMVEKSKASKSNSANEAVIRAKLVQRVSKAFQHLGAEGGTIRLRLAPAELGSVRVEMQIQGRKVNARVVAETEAASSILRDHLADLKNRLESQGMQVERFEIETDEASFSKENNWFSQNSGGQYQEQAYDERYERYPISQRTGNASVSRSVSPSIQASGPISQAAGVDIRL